MHADNLYVNGAIMIFAFGMIFCSMHENRVFCLFSRFEIHQVYSSYIFQVEELEPKDSEFKASVRHVSSNRSTLITKIYQ